MDDRASIRGPGLARAQRALALLEEHPELLERDRRRFSHSPLRYASDMSGTTTRSQSPNPPTEEQRLREERRSQLAGERQASQPRRQFRTQVEAERRRIWFSEPGTDLLDITIDIYGFQEEAQEIVKKRWVEQGIWNNKWNYFTIGRWKHEEPLELESESETDTEAESFSFLREEPKPRRPKSDEEKRRIQERRIVREREREASRPYHQFVYQVSKERERIQEESANNREGTDDADINTRAYEVVRGNWTIQGMWKTRWGILPGMSWKHEEPLEIEAADIRNAQPSVNQEAVNHEAVNRPLFGPLPPVESNHREASAVMTTPQQGPPIDIDSAGFENGDAEHPPRRNKRTQLPVSSVAKDPPRRSKRIQPPVSSVAKDPPRRSKRIQPPVSSVAKDLAKTVSTNPSKRAVRSRPERKVTNSPTARSSAKPQGISKKQPAKITQRRARGKINN